MMFDHMAVWSIAGIVLIVLLVLAIAKLIRK